jgi:hypothetical protein
MGRIYRDSTRVMSTVIMLLGLVILVTTLARGGGPISLGVVMGVLFTALGAGRLYLAGGFGRQGS